MDNDINEIREKLEKLRNPDKKFLSILKEEDLKNLGETDLIVMKVKEVDGLELYIRREYMLDQVLNVPVIFYGYRYMILDNENKVRPQHDLFLEESETISYVEELLNSRSVFEFNYIRSLKEKGVEIGDVILLSNGKKGVVCFPVEITYNRNLRYIPLKKDGTLSKSRPRLLYGGESFEKTGEQFV